MRAVVIPEHGDESVLTVMDVPEPVPSDFDVTVAVTASALNRADLMQRLGRYPQPGPKSEHEIPGMEFAGTVTAIGKHVSTIGVGDEIMGIVSGEAQAEVLVTHERLAMPVPAAVSLQDAAAIPEVFITAYDALVVQGGLTAGRRCLVHAGASGVGTAAIQLAKAMGAFVAVTCSSGKVEACANLGADLVIDYTTTDFPDAIASWTGGAGVDVVLDVIGGDYLAKNLDSIRVGGTVMQVGIMTSPMATFPLAAMLGKRAKLIGTVLRSRPIEEKIAITQRVIAEVNPMFDSGALVPVIDSRYPLEQIAESHRYMATNANVGKILITV
jgi:NADPH2:quinone reductase